MCKLRIQASALPLIEIKSNLTQIAIKLLSLASIASFRDFCMTTVITVTHFASLKFKGHCKHAHPFISVHVAHVQ